MKKLLAIVGFLIGVLLFSLWVLNQPAPKLSPGDVALDAMASIPESELLQTPHFSTLPDNAGWLLAMTFTNDLTDQQAAIFLASEIAIIQFHGEKFDGKVVVYVYISKNKSVSVTADFAANLVEFWETSDRETYVKRMFDGAPDDVLNYLAWGYTAEPRIERGRIEEEGKSNTGARQGL